LTGVRADIHLLPKKKVQLLSREIQKYYRNQNWALILEPVDSDAEEWKRIAIARIADELPDGWDTRIFSII
jgi:hypothetical protein